MYNMQCKITFASWYNVLLFMFCQDGQKLQHLLRGHVVALETPFPNARSRDQLARMLNAIECNRLSIVAIDEIEEIDAIDEIVS